MELKSIFGGSAPLTIDDIQTAVRQEVTAALSERAFEDEIINASATLQSVQDFMSNDYPIAVGQGSNLFDINSLSGQTIGPILRDIEHDLNALRTFMDTNDTKTAATGISVSLGLHLYKSIVYLERAKFGDAQTNFADMQSYARNGIRDIAPRLAKLVEARFASLVYFSDDNPNMEDGDRTKIKEYCTIDSLHDTWIDTWLFAFKAYNDTTMDYAAALNWVIRANRKLLWSGAQADADEFARSLTDGWLRPPGSFHFVHVTPFADNFRDTCSTANRDFGKFIRSVSNGAARA